MDISVGDLAPQKAPATSFSTGLARRFKVYVVWGAMALAALAAGLTVPQLLPRPSDTGAKAVTAETKSPATESVAGEPEGSDNGYLSMMTAAFLPASVLIAMGWFWRAGAKTKRAKAAATGMEVVETLPLGGRCLIYVVKAGDAELLAGVDRSGVKAVIPIPSMTTMRLSDADAEPHEESLPVQPLPTTHKAQEIDRIFLTRFCELMANRSEGSP
jgi:flagellar biogenesis protein FliO